MADKIMGICCLCGSFYLGFAAVWALAGLQTMADSNSTPTATVSPGTDAVRT